MDLTVCTTVWGDYGRWLEQWAESITASTVPPVRVVIAEFGDCAHQAKTAAEMLHCRGIPASVVTEPYTGMASARNTAVGAAGSEWVMHLDADDLLLPDTVSRVAAVADRFDVISLAARYQTGKIRAFPAVSARSILSGRLGCFSCAPFRRTLWEQSPYQTLPGPLPYVDSLLWVGFAHLGARFVGMRQPGFIYRQHYDSFKRTLTPVQLAAARRQVSTAIRAKTSASRHTRST